METRRSLRRKRPGDNEASIQTAAQIIPQVRIFRRRLSKKDIDDQFTQTDHDCCLRAIEALTSKLNGHSAQHLERLNDNSNGIGVAQNGSHKHPILNERKNELSSLSNRNGDHAEENYDSTDEEFADDSSCETFTNGHHEQQKNGKSKHEKSVQSEESNYSLDEAKFTQLLESNFDEVAEWFASYCAANGKQYPGRLATRSVSDKSTSMRVEVRNMGTYCSLQKLSGSVDGQRTPRVDLSRAPSVTTIAEYEDELCDTSVNTTHTQATLSATMNKQNGSSDGGLLLTVDTSRSQMLRPDELIPVIALSSSLSLSLSSSRRGSVEWTTGRVPPLNLSLTHLESSIPQTLSARESVSHSPAAFGSAQFGSAIFGSGNFSASLGASARSRRGCSNQTVQTEHYFDQQILPKMDSQLLTYTEAGCYIIPCQVRHVYDSRENKWLSGSDAELAGCFDASKSVFKDTVTGASVPLDEAIRRKLVRVDSVEGHNRNSGSLELKASRVRLRKFLPSPFYITSVLNKATGDRVAYCEALALGLIKESTQYIDQVTGISESLKEAIESGSVEIEFWNPNGRKENYASQLESDDSDSDAPQFSVELPPFQTKRILAQMTGFSQSPLSPIRSDEDLNDTQEQRKQGPTVQVFAVHKVIDCSTGLAYNFDAALQRGLLDRRSGKYMKPLNVKRSATDSVTALNFEEAVAAGYIEAVLLE